jgi:hypothetical protein
MPERLEKELLGSLMISEEEYRRLMGYGKWLNELGAPPQAETEEEILEEEEE